MIDRPFEIMHLLRDSYSWNFLEAWHPGSVSNAIKITVHHTSRTSFNKLMALQDKWKNKKRPSRIKHQMRRLSSRAQVITTCAPLPVLTSNAPIETDMFQFSCDEVK